MEDMTIFFESSEVNSFPLGGCNGDDSFISTTTSFSWIAFSSLDFEECFFPPDLNFFDNPLPDKRLVLECDRLLFLFFLFLFFSDL